MYEQLKELLREVIQSGEFAEREREVVEHYQVSRPTANKVLSGMAAEGLVEFRKGVGTLVRRRRLDYFAAKIFHAHVKDARINRQKLNEAGILAHPLKYHYPRLLGLRDIDWSAFFAALTETRPDVSVAIEAEDRAYEGSLQNQILGLRQAPRFLSQFCATSQDERVP